jgi:hypothetical protein
MVQTLLFIGILIGMGISAAVLALSLIAMAWWDRDKRG